LAVPGIGFPQNISVGPNVLDPEDFWDWSFTARCKTDGLHDAPALVPMRASRDLDIAPWLALRGHDFLPCREMRETSVPTDFFRRTHYEKSASKAPLSLATPGHRSRRDSGRYGPRGAGMPASLARLATLPPASNSRNLREKLQKSNGATVNSLRTSPD
jgi:hypothetical protein